MRVGSPCSDNSIVGTVAKGARSESAETVRVKPGRLRVGGALGGDEDSTSVEEVGTGVG